MLFKEIYNETPTDLYSYVVNKYGSTIADWFNLKFKNYELLYEQERFIDLFKSSLIENHIELLKIKKLMEQQEMWALGNVADSSTDMTNTSNSTGIQSYQGYNVEGDFSKNTAESNSSGNSTAKSTSINNTDEFNKLIAFDYSTLLDKIYDKFVVLFILCYN